MYYETLVDDILYVVSYVWFLESQEAFSEVVHERVNRVLNLWTTSAYCLDSGL